MVNVVCSRICAAAGQRLAGVLILEFQVVRLNDNRGHLKRRVDRDIQAFQVPVGDRQTWSGAVTERHTQRIHSIERHRSATRHCEDVLRRVILARIRAITEGLTGIVVREFQAGGGKRHATDMERGIGIHRQVQVFQVPVGDRQSRRGTVTECHAQRIGSIERHRRRTRHREHILCRVIRPRIRAIAEGLTGIVVREFQTIGGKRHATDVEG